MSFKQTPEIIIPQATTLTSERDIIAYFKNKFLEVRQQSASICAPLEIEDYVVQPVVDVSPPKWHLGHTTWFFETFVLQTNLPDYKLFHRDYGYVFNSYYETVGTRVLRTNRGNLTRPSVEDVYKYRKYVDEHMMLFLESVNDIPRQLQELLELGLQHEQQHQELLLYDIKFILGHNPLFPAYIKDNEAPVCQRASSEHLIEVNAGNYTVGYQGNEFSFDNEHGAHTTYLHDYAIANRMVTNGEYMEFIEAGGYTNFKHWFSEAWDWVNKDKKEAPLYWHKIDGGWYNYTFYGLQKLDVNAPVSHISLFEADAYARWREMRLPTEFEWEVAVGKLANQIPDNANFVDKKAFAPLQTSGDLQFFGNLWEWTNSSYLPYPYFKTASGAIGEYNGKFMINQMVLRGGSYATPKNHIRPTYRNFFHPNLQWHFAGIRLAKHL